LKAVLKVSEGEARELAPGLRAEVDYRAGKVAGRVARVEPAVRGGTVTVEVALADAMPPGARSDLSVDALIDFERIDDALVLARPAASDGSGMSGQRLGLFRLDPDGTTATRTEVALGRTSNALVEIASGLAPGDRVIVSDMTGWQSVRQIRLR
jgi:HlyD family secretion protein